MFYFYDKTLDYNFQYQIRINLVLVPIPHSNGTRIWFLVHFFLKNKMVSVFKSNLVPIWLRIMQTRTNEYIIINYHIDLFFWN
jgi:hypothetical protein